jgi:hypothetical protein
MASTVSIVRNMAANAAADNDTDLEYVIVASGEAEALLRKNEYLQRGHTCPGRGLVAEQNHPSITPKRNLGIMQAKADPLNPKTSSCRVHRRVRLLDTYLLSSTSVDTSHL